LAEYKDTQAISGIMVSSRQTRASVTGNIMVLVGRMIPCRPAGIKIVKMMYHLQKVSFDVYDPGITQTGVAHRLEALENTYPRK